MAQFISVICGIAALICCSSAQNNASNLRQNFNANQMPNSRQQPNNVNGGSQQFAPNCFCQTQTNNQMFNSPFGDAWESQGSSKSRAGPNSVGSKPSVMHMNPLPQSGIPPTLIYCDNYGQQHQDHCRLAISLAMDPGMGIRPCMANSEMSNIGSRGEVFSDANSLSRPGSGGYEEQAEGQTPRQASAARKTVKRQAGFDGRQSYYIYCLSNGSTVTSDPSSLQQAMMFNTGLGVRCQGSCPCRIQCPQTSAQMENHPSLGVNFNNQFNRPAESNAFGADANHGLPFEFGQPGSDMQRLGNADSASSWNPRQPYQNINNVRQFPTSFNNQGQQYPNQQNFRPETAMNRDRLSDFGVNYGSNSEPPNRNQNNGFYGQAPSQLPVSQLGATQYQQQYGSPNSEGNRMNPSNFGQHTDEYPHVPYGPYGDAENQPTYEENIDQDTDNPRNFEQENYNHNQEESNGQTRSSGSTLNHQQQQNEHAVSHSRPTTRTTTPKPRAGR